MKRAQFFDRHGRALSEAEALDSQGLVKDGVTMRTRMIMRDDATISQHVHDASLHRPGFRLRDRMNTAARQAAYDSYHDDLVSAYLNPPTSFGERGNVVQREGRAGQLRRGDQAQLFSQLEAIDAKRRVPRYEKEEDQDGHDQMRRRTDDDEDDDGGGYEETAKQIMRRASAHHESRNVPPVVITAASSS